MKRVAIPQGAWVVVCDGAKAIILENIGDAEIPNLRTVEAVGQADLPSRDLRSDAAGRTRGPIGPASAAIEQTDYHRKAEEDFLTGLARQLDRAVQSKSAKGLVVVAPPRALGVLRGAYTQHIRDALIAEVDKDLVALSIGDIERHLAGDPPQSPVVTHRTPARAGRRSAAEATAPASKRRRRH